jgi:autotransporter-associated beta strand protein
MTKISGSGNLLIGQNAAGTAPATTWDSLVTLTGSNALFIGNIVVESGGLQITDAAALGTGPKNIQLTNGTNGRPHFYLDGSGGNITLPTGINFVTSSANLSHPAIGNLAGDNVINGNVTLAGGGGSTAVNVSGGSLALNGLIATNTSGRFLILGGNTVAPGTINGVISDGTNPLGLTISGTNTWTLTAANAYTGITTVNAGTLLVNGIQNLATGAVTVAGGSLGGIGTIGGNITVNAAGTLAPGQSVGTLTTVNSVTLNGKLSIEIDGASTDKLVVGSTLNITNGTLDLTEINPASGTPIIIASYGGLTGTQFATVNGLPSGYTINYNYNSLNQIALVSSGGDYTTWAGGFPGFIDTAPGSDPDGDGLTNQQEYAFGLDPTSGSSVSPITQMLSQTGGTFKYTRRLPGLTGLTYTYESSTTLSGWDLFVPVSEATNSGTPVEEITVTVPPALLTDPKVFVRVKAN